MRPKPSHLGPEYGSQFSDPSVVNAYRLRPPYPEEAISFLLDLSIGRGALLDIGCGRGNLTVPLAASFERVDAVDPSAAMLLEAKRQAGPQLAHVRWIQSTLAGADLEGSYDLITAGESLHWTDWPVVFPKLARLLAPGARLALVHRTYSAPPWESELRALIALFSTNREYEPYDLVQELENRGHFTLTGRHDTVPRPFIETLDAYIESFHSANGFSKDRMAPDAAAAFDREVRALVRRHQGDREVALEIAARIEYGTPRAGK
ncbi:MAG: class I SAM-dependent methyltransferase [Planctomycetota bacterium]